MCYFYFPRARCERSSNHVPLQYMVCDMGSWKDLQARKSASEEVEDLINPKICPRKVWWILSFLKFFLDWFEIASKYNFYAKVNSLQL